MCVWVFRGAVCVSGFFCGVVVCLGFPWCGLYVWVFLWCGCVSGLSVVRLSAWAFPWSGCPTGSFPGAALAGRGSSRTSALCPPHSAGCSDACAGVISPGSRCSRVRAPFLAGPPTPILGRHTGGVGDALFPAADPGIVQDPSGRKGLPGALDTNSKVTGQVLSIK